MVVVIGPLSGGHTHKTADRPIIPSSLTPPLNIVHRIFSLDRPPAVLLLPASKAARPLHYPGRRSPGQPRQDDFLFFIELPLGGARRCSAPRPGPLVTRYVSVDKSIQVSKPRTLSSKQCQESSNQRPSPSASPSAPVPAVSWSAQRQPHVFLHTLHCSRPRRPQTAVECPWSCSRHALQNTLQGVHLLACTALQLDQTPAGCWPPLLAASPGGGCLFALPRGFCPTGPRGVHGKKIDRSDHSAALLRRLPI